MSLVEVAVCKLVESLGDRVVAVALFGSRARGESSEHSDYDFLVIVRDMDECDRRFKIYDPLYKVLKRDITVIDISEDKIFRENLEIDSFLLNIAYDGVILYDPSGKLKELFNRIKKAIKGKLVRYKTKDGKYGWKPLDGFLKPIEV